MARDRPRNDERCRIAHLAARLMAEDGVEDYGLAKRKAARQAGVPNTRQLPTNEEIDAALRLHQSLYQAEEHPQRLRFLREQAIACMSRFAQFNPYLTGSVLSGNAGKYADIDLQLYPDNPKGPELFLIDHRIPYKLGDVRLYIGGEARMVPVLTVEQDGTNVRLVVLSAAELRGPVRSTAEGKAIERAKLAAVEALLDED